MRRREFIGLLGGPAMLWPLSLSAQLGSDRRRIGMLLPAAADDEEYRPRMQAFELGLEQLGWIIGSNVRIDVRWATADAGAIGKQARDLVALAPDVIVAHGSATAAALLQVTRNLPIVFPVAGDPVAAGLVESLARPGTNATGFMDVEFSIGAKWLELLKQIMPDVKRVAVFRDPAVASGTGQLGSIQTAAPALGIEVTPAGVRDAAEIERTFGAFAHAPNGGVIVTASPSAQHHRKLIVALAARHALAGIYFQRAFVANGGLASYGPDIVDHYRKSAGYVDRILKGEKVTDLPVQAPTKYELVINLKTAKALGLTLSPTVLARADEVIE